MNLKDYKPRPCRPFPFSTAEKSTLSQDDGHDCLLSTAALVQVATSLAVPPPLCSSVVIRDGRHSRKRSTQIKVASVQFVNPTFTTVVLSKTNRNKCFIYGEVET
ncbi:hypothetical protein PGQ11_002534 [Apiospora arundinis]|uniref:Uncharacterized protein n=1 Tax=Apiospora arundinis TaxID=335852 RepID=A0ABR2JIG4_9PEZI